MRTVFCVNVLCAVGHIKRTDGFLGLYRGLTPRLFSAVIGTLVTNAVNTVSVAQHCNCCMFSSVLLTVLIVFSVRYIHQNESSCCCHYIRPSGTGVCCDNTVHISTDLSLWSDRSVFGHPDTKACTPASSHLFQFHLEET